MPFKLNLDFCRLVILFIADLHISNYLCFCRATNPSPMTMTMLMKSLVTCHTFGVTSSLTRALLGPVSPRVGCGIKMGQARYTAQISVPTTVQYFSYNTSTLSTLQRRLPYNALAARLCALCPPQCAHHTTFPPISLSWSNLTRDKLKKP